jgi:mannose-1-phosphate guanylyltransferase
MVLLLAGGRGERFWPRSTRLLPKQFLPMPDEKSLLRHTFERVAGLVDPASVFVITGQEFKELVRRDLPEVPDSNLILEPVGRNTAPALGLAALLLAPRDPEAVLVALPADHHVVGDARFRATIAAAVAAAAADRLVTVGVRPTRAETGYGYIRTGPLIGERSGLPVHAVREFVEKPDVETARRYCESGLYLWNCGILVAKLAILREEIAAHLPEVDHLLEQMAAGNPSREGLRGQMAARVAACFPAMPAISVDHGVLERSERVAVVPADFPWTDMGDWAALSRVLPLDERGNGVRGDALLRDCDGLVVDAFSGRLVVALGTKDLVIVDSDRAVLVCPKDRVQEVRAVAEPAAAGGEALERSRLPEGRTIQQPWGREIWWAVAGAYAARLIQVYARRTQGAQRFRRRHETILVQRGEGRLLIGDNWCELRPGSVHALPPGVDYRIEARSDLTLIGVGTPEVAES